MYVHTNSTAKAMLPEIKKADNKNEAAIIMAKACAASGIQMPAETYETYMAILDFPDHTSADIAKYLGFGFGHISSLCSSMEQRGMIKSVKKKTELANGISRMVKRFHVNMSKFRLLPRPSKQPAPPQYNYAVKVKKEEPPKVVNTTTTEKLQAILDDLKLSEIRQLSSMIHALGISL